MIDRDDDLGPAIYDKGYAAGFLAGQKAMWLLLDRAHYQLYPYHAREYIPAVSPPSTMKGSVLDRVPAGEHLGAPVDSTPPAGEPDTCTCGAC